MKGKVHNTLRRLNELEEYQPYTQPLSGNISFTKRIIDNSKVTDHHAIIPTDAKLRVDSLTEEEKKVCEAVTGFKYEDLWKESNGLSFK